MTTLVAYTGVEPVALADVKLHCKIDHDAEDTYITNTLIPSARSLAESKTGSIIRKGTFTETVAVGTTLSVGQVNSVNNVKIDGDDVPFMASMKGRRTLIESVGNEGKLAVVTFAAGVDIEQFPSVRSWLLLACGWMYEHRELMASGPNAFNRMPESYVDALLNPIMLPNPF